MLVLLLVMLLVKLIPAAAAEGVDFSSERRDEDGEVTVFLILLTDTVSGTPAWNMLS
jgi:hypothetical protein